MKMQNISTYFIYSVLVMLLIVSIAGIVSAHRIYVDVTSQTIEIEAYYGDGKPARNADVTVYKSNDEVYLTGKTDDDGKFSFEVKDVDTEHLRIEVEQIGHKAEVNIGSGFNSDGGEIPLYQRVIAGLGYLLGLAGLSSLYVAWKLNKKSKLKEIT
jgi:nickel transport protein